jgi:serine/threonine-protein kinase
MTPERWQQIDQLFHAALVYEPAQRDVFLASACADDEPLRVEVESLLSFHDGANSFIETPAGDVAAELLGSNNSKFQPGHKFDNYRIMRQLAESGMGEVYLAEDLRLGRQVALKRLPAHFTLDAERVRRLGQEARAASALNHPNIVTIYEVGHSDSQHFIATEFIVGQTLRKHMSGSPMKLDEVLDVSIQIVSALETAHAAGIVHRDIKPENLMIRPDGYVKVLDFGLAKLVEKENQPFIGFEGSARNQTAQGIILGTVNYMSPEQAKGECVDERTDIFSFGVVLFEMIAGKTPFAGDSTAETLANLINAEPQPLYFFAARVPDELQRIVAKTLRKNKDERYQFMKDVFIDLKEVKENLTLGQRLERSHPPKIEEPVAGLTATAGGHGKQAVVATKTGLFQKIFSHKLSAILALIILLAAIGFGLWRFRISSVNAKQVESIAVMPFVNESGNADVEYLADGMTETLIDSLSQLPGLNVKARSSVFRYKGRETNANTIGTELRVQAVLNGRVVQRGQDLTLYLELVDTQTGNRIWGDQYNRKQTDMVSLQSEIAQDVSQKLRLKLSGADQEKLAKTYTKNVEAYQLYLRGNFHVEKRTEKEIRKGIEYLEQAIAIDPNYALAYAGLGSAYVALPNYSKVPWLEVMPKVKDATLKALSLDNELAEAHTLLGVIMSLDGDDAGAEREYQRAMQLNQNSAMAYHFYSNHLRMLGKLEEAVTQQRRAVETEPLSLIVNREYGSKLFFARRYDEAIAQFRKTIELDPGFPSAHYGLALVYWMKGNYAEAVEEHAKHQELSGEPQKAALLRESFAKGGWEEFLRTITDENNHIDLSWDSLAAYYAALGKKDKAFALMAKRFENRKVRPGALMDPRLDPLRDDPRFAELVSATMK